MQASAVEKCAGLSTSVVENFPAKKAADVRLLYRQASGPWRCLAEHDRQDGQYDEAVTVRSYT